MAENTNSHEIIDHGVNIMSPSKKSFGQISLKQLLNPLKLKRSELLKILYRYGIPILKSQINNDWFLLDCFYRFITPLPQKQCYGGEDKYEYLLDPDSVICKDWGNVKSEPKELKFQASSYDASIQNEELRGLSGKRSTPQPEGSIKRLKTSSPDVHTKKRSCDENTQPSDNLKKLKLEAIEQNVTTTNRVVVTQYYTTEHLNKFDAVKISWP